MHQGLKRDHVLAVCGLSKHQFYYQPTGGKPGRRPSGHTLRLVEGERVKVTNRDVVAEIRTLLADPRVDYGYRKMCGKLTLMGYYLNHKKAYRLMKGARLLQPKAEKEAKNHVKYRIVCPEGPLRLMEMDIKMVWLEGRRCYGYILSILDVFTRVVLHWDLGLQMRQKDVERSWAVVIEQHLQAHAVLGWETHIEIRSDNGPQFCAQKLQQFFKDNYLMQSFTHPYTPQENGHIESFHAILSKNLKGKHFDDLRGLCQELQGFYPFYNYQRIHASTLHTPPMTFWTMWNKQQIQRIVLDEKKRKVKFKLNIPRQQIDLVGPTEK